MADEEEHGEVVNGAPEDVQRQGMELADSLGESFFGRSLTVMFQMEEGLEVSLFFSD